MICFEICDMVGQQALRSQKREIYSRIGCICGSQPKNVWLTGALTRIFRSLRSYLASTFHDWLLSIRTCILPYRLCASSLMTIWVDRVKYSGWLAEAMHRQHISSTLCTYVYVCISITDL